MPLNSIVPGDCPVNLATNLYEGPSNDRVRLIAQARLAGNAIVRGLTDHGLADGMRVLDVGCGVGLIAHAIAEACPTAEVVGVDCDERALEDARRLGDRVRFISGDAGALLVPDEQFDFVVASMLFMHLADRAGVLAECRRVLAPGGRLCIVDTDDALWLVEPPCAAFDELKALLGWWYAISGGSRHVGRELPRLMADAGFVERRLEVRNQSTLDIGEEAFDRTYFEIFRVQQPRIIATGLCDRKEAEGLLAELDEAVANGYFGTICAVFASGTRP